jgi:predicted AAA+ superfamily ATPase
MGRLEPVRHVSTIQLADLHEIDAAEGAPVAQHGAVRGRPAGQQRAADRGPRHRQELADQGLPEHLRRPGLRLIEIDKADLVDLPDVVELVSRRPERFIVFCDDLSFEEGESGYKALKSILDGSVAAASDNVLIYATSNRRHLLPETMKDNLSYQHTEDGELHPGEVVEEKISLSERFGLWISFYPFSQPEYLAIVAQWLSHFGLDAAAIEAARPEALVFALERGSRSGRVAYQFARDLAGRRALDSGAGSA